MKLCVTKGPGMGEMQADIYGLWSGMGACQGSGDRRFQGLRAILSLSHCAWKALPRVSGSSPVSLLPTEDGAGSAWLESVFFPPKADRSLFYFLLCKLENERPHLGCGRCIVYLGVQGEPHINVFLMCLSHVQSRREGKRPGGLLSPSPFLCLPGACLLECWAN